MSRKWEILKKITDSGLVVVIRADNADTAKGSPTHALKRRCCDRNNLHGSRSHKSY